MLKKKFLKTKCKVEFSLPADIAEDVKSVHLIGDFNAWNKSATPMEKKGKTFKVTVDLSLNQDYEFRYLINGKRWHNDVTADGLVPNAFGSQNNIVSTQPPK